MSYLTRTGLAILLIALGSVRLLSFQTARTEATPPPDLVLINGKIVTLDPALPEGQALAVRNGTVVRVGSTGEIRSLVGPSTQVIDLEGRLAIPAFIESHAHFTGLGDSLRILNLRDTRNWEEIVAAVEKAVAKTKPGEWILGRGWHQEKWDRKPAPEIEGFPIHQALSKVSPDNPVLLTHASGHASFANQKAMELAGVTPQTPNPKGGEILKDPQGNPIGVFRETASGLINRALQQSRARRTAEESQADLRRSVELAAGEALSKGIATFHDAGASFSTVDLYKRMADEGRLGVRLYVMLGEPNARLAENLPKYRLLNYGNGFLTVRSIKRLIDGALGPRGAWLIEPYEDLPSSTGLNTTSPTDIRETARLALQHDFQLCVHAIGDRANRETLNLYEEAFKSKTDPSKKDLRWRIEHAQHISSRDIPRFGALGVIAAMQGIHCTSDAPYVLARLGARRAEEGAYVWQKLMRSGAVVSNGTDAPVEAVSPVDSFYATVSRRLKDGSLFYPEQRMSRLEALKSYTLNGAYAGFEENQKGSLSPGKLADITVLSRDILTVPEEQIPGTEVLYTIVGGKVAFKKR